MNTMSSRRPHTWIDDDEAGFKIGFALIFINLGALGIYGLFSPIPLVWVFVTAVSILGFPLAAAILAYIFTVVLDKLYAKKYKKYVEERNFMNWVKGCRK